MNSCISALHHVIGDPSTMEGKDARLSRKYGERIIISCTINGVIIFSQEECDE